MAQNPWSLPRGLTSAERKAVGAIFQSLRKMNRTLSPEMRNALQAGNIDQFIQLVDVESLVDLGEYKNIITDMARKAGLEALKPIGGINADLAFNLIDERAIAYAQTRSSQLITNITGELRETIMQSVAESMQGDFTVDELARRVRRNLPLTPRDAKAANRFFERNWNRFMEQGLTARQARERAEEKTKKYSEKLTRRRAKTIARTELADSAMQGRLMGWEVGIQEGMIDNQSKKEWIAEPDACKVCSPLDGMIILWNKEFPFGGRMAPAHPNCRCSVVLMPPETEETPYTEQADAEYEKPERITDALEIGEDREKFEQFQQEYRNGITESITEDEGYAVVDYTREGPQYEEVNGFLRQKEGYELDEFGETQAIIDNLDSAIAKSPPLPQDTVVYRGMSMPKDNFQFIEEFTDDGFVSTSHNPNISAMFTREQMHEPVMFRMTLPKGTKTLDPTAFKIEARLQTGINTGISHASERELILPRGGRYKIVGKRDFIDDAGKTMPMYEVELVNG